MSIFSGLLFAKLTDFAYIFFLFPHTVLVVIYPAVLQSILEVEGQGALLFVHHVVNIAVTSNGHF